MKSIFEIGQSRVRRPSIRYGLVGSIEANGCLRKPVRAAAGRN
jgi:hypothetical protein